MRAKDLSPPSPPPFPTRFLIAGGGCPLPVSTPGPAVAASEPVEHFALARPNRPRRYEWLHELSRPIEVPRLESNSTRFYSGGGGATVFWNDFHKGHPKLLVGGQYPYCEGYVGTPGQMWPKPPLVPDQIVAASNAMDCCNKCKGLPKDKSCNGDRPIPLCAPSPHTRQRSHTTTITHARALLRE